MYEQYCAEDRWEIGGDDIELLWSWEKDLNDMGLTPDDWDAAIASMEADFMTSGGHLWN